MEKGDSDNALDTQHAQLDQTWELPHQQQQVIIYIYNACPYQGSIDFATNEGTIVVPVAC